MRFDGFEGNEEAKHWLSAYVDGGRLPHALLLEGPEGSGRRTLARLLAQATVCTADGPKPCGKCAACTKTMGGNHPDIFETGGDGASRSVHIDMIRKIRESVYVLPNEAERRVVILAGAQAMTEQAQNALLKILEEPPPHVLFILTCDNHAQLLTTIQSRTVCITLGAVAEDTCVSTVLRILPEADEATVRQAATVFGGIIGQAVHGLGEGTFSRVLELAPKFARAVVAPNELELLRLTGQLEKDKEAIHGVLNTLMLLFRDALLHRFDVCADGSVSPEVAELLARTLTKEQLVSLVKTIEELQLARLHNVNNTLFLTLLCSRLRTAVGR